jgi:hypothetical protein
VQVSDRKVGSHPSSSWCLRARFKACFQDSQTRSFPDPVPHHVMKNNRRRRTAGTRHALDGEVDSDEANGGGVGRVYFMVHAARHTEPWAVGVRPARRRSGEESTHPLDRCCTAPPAIVSGPANPLAPPPLPMARHESAGSGLYQAPTPSTNMQATRPERDARTRETRHRRPHV